MRKREGARDKEREETREKERGNQRESEGERGRKREGMRKGEGGEGRSERETEGERERKREGARERRRERGDEIDWCDKFDEKERRERGKQRQDQQSCGFWIGHNFSNCVFFSLSFSHSLAPSLHMHFPVFASVKKT